MKKLKVIYYTLRLPSAEQADGQFFASAPPRRALPEFAAKSHIHQLWSWVIPQIGSLEFLSDVIRRPLGKLKIKTSARFDEKSTY